MKSDALPPLKVLSSVRYCIDRGVGVAVTPKSCVAPRKSVVVPRTVRLPDPQIGFKMPLRPRPQTLSVAYSPDGKTLAIGRQFAISRRTPSKRRPRGISAWAAGDIVFFDTLTHSIRRSVPFVYSPQDATTRNSLGGPSALEFSADGRYLMGSSWGTHLAVLDVSTSRWIVVRQAKHKGLNGPFIRFNPAGFSNDGRIAIFCEQWRAPDSRVDTRLFGEQQEWLKDKLHHATLVFCDITTGRVKRRVSLQLKPGEWPLQIRLLRDDKRVALSTVVGDELNTYGSNGKLILFNQNTGKRLQVLDDRFVKVRDMDVSPDAQFLAITCEGPRKALRIYSLRSNKHLLHLPDLRSSHRLAYSPSGQMLAVSKMGSPVPVQLLTSPGLKAQRLLVTDKSCFDFAFSPDGRVLATSGFDTHFRLWRVQ